MVNVFIIYQNETKLGKSEKRGNHARINWISKLNISAMYRSTRWKTSSDDRTEKCYQPQNSIDTHRSSNEVILQNTFYLYSYKTFTRLSLMSKETISEE